MNTQECRKRPASAIDCPYDAAVATERDYVETTKAYRNREFMNSREARHIRILCEFEETRKRLQEQQIAGTILFLGSRRALGTVAHATRLAELEEELRSVPEDRGAVVKEAIDRHNRLGTFCKLVDRCEELARRLSEWTLTFEGPQLEVKSPPAVSGPQPGFDAALNPAVAPTQRLVVCTGGGPGFMEAANRGAAQVPHAKSMGMSTHPPSVKDTLTSFVTPALAFTFHYGFSNKFWMLYPAKAVVACPGGFSTCDELFEVLTLKQTGKVPRDLPVVLLGKDHWQQAFDFQTMVDYGVIGEQDIQSFLLTDDVQEAFSFITTAITRASP